MKKNCLICNKNYNNNNYCFSYMIIIGIFNIYNDIKITRYSMTINLN